MYTLQIVSDQKQSDESISGRFTYPIMRGRNVVTVGGETSLWMPPEPLCVLVLKSIIVYRRSEQEMPAREAEIHHAKQEGIIFNYLCNPVEILDDSNGFVQAVRCIRMELGEPDSSGRRRPIPVQGSEFDIPCDVVIIAIGNSPNPLISMSTPDIKISKRGTIEADEKDGRTSKNSFTQGRYRYRCRNCHPCYGGWKSCSQKHYGRSACTC